MNLRLENLAMLFGLFALGVPIVLHFLQRRRFDVVDWGAMQFLPDAVTTQRRRWLDEILLMLLRMGMLAILVVALATPIASGDWLAWLGNESGRDVIIVLDGSFSMDARLTGQSSPLSDAVKQTRRILEESSPADRHAIMIARQPPLFWQHDLSDNVDELLQKLADLPLPAGNPDLPRALDDAWKHLQAHSQSSAKQIVVLSDKQLYGWADRASLNALDQLGERWHADIQRAKADGVSVPSLRVVKVGAELPKQAPNFSLAPLTASRGMARIGQKVAFQTALHLDGFASYEKPRDVAVHIDGKRVQALELPTGVELKQGQVPLRFDHKFEIEGVHVVSLILDADRDKDVLPADNAQHLAVTVVKELPILLVEADERASTEGSAFFLQRALSRGKSDEALKIIAASSLKPDHLKSDGGTKPAVVILADVPQLSAVQIEALDGFFSDGGGLWIIAGERVAKQAAFYNERLYRSGKGWSPARLDDVASAKDGMPVEPRTFQHPALEIFRQAEQGRPHVRFGSWLKVKHEARDGGAVVARLASGDPLLIEKPFKKGRVLLSTVGMDRRWDSTLPSAPEFPILVNELASYLAGARADGAVLHHGEPIRLRLGSAKPRIMVRTPESTKPRSIVSAADEFRWEDVGAVGVYDVDVAGERHAFVVRPDPNEAVLTRMSDDDWQRVRNRLPVAWADDVAQTTQTSTQSVRRDLWWVLFVALVGFLCAEVWMTRRLAMARGR